MPDALVSTEVEAKRALLGRPRLSIRTRVGGMFVLLFLLICGVTAAALVLVSELKTKSQFLETAGNYSFEIQQARRFEKNFFLYGTNLRDALANVQAARTHLTRNTEEMWSVLGREKHHEMQENLTRYEEALEKLFEIGDSPQEHGNAERAGIEARLRKYGAQILSDAQAVIDREREAMHSMLRTSMFAAGAFLAFMFIVMAGMAAFIIRTVLAPLDRAVKHAARIGQGDYTPLLPARRFRDEFSELSLAFNEMLHELKLRQDQLLQSTKMAAIGTLTSGVAHELNNPLNNMGLTAEALLDGFESYSDQEKRKMLEQLYVQVERASSTVRNLLDFTRKEQPARTRVSVPSVLESAAKLVGHEMSLKGIALRLDASGHLPAIAGNPGNLQQVFVNLFLNSIQAMPRGGRLSVRAAAEDGFVRVDVSDTGCGILKENLDKVFVPFFTTKEPGQGTGLGLSVSYSIVEKHGGRITVESEVGKGATFSVFLPAEPAPAAGAPPGGGPA